LLAEFLPADLRFARENFKHRENDPPPRNLVVA
jgi:hypothetical protein